TAMRQTIVWPPRRRAGPKFVIEIVRDFLQRRIAVRAHVEVTAQLHVANLAEQAGIDDLFFGVDEVRGAFALAADLADAFGLAGGGEHGRAFADVAADGLLAIDIRA